MANRTWFGYPGWFVTLFCTDMWERFSFYGMHALLVLFLTAPRHAGGLGFTAGGAGALFGLYIAAAFLTPLAGGWLGDRVLGARQATLAGAVTITAGHCLLLAPLGVWSLTGLALIAAGTGLMKPNLAAILSRFYGPDRPAAREAAFSVFYMSIQLSALAAPLVTGVLGERYNWHLGFGAAALGMALGAGYFAATSSRFGVVGRHPADPIPPAALRRVVRRVLAVLVPVATLLTIDVASGHFTVEHPLGMIGLAVIATPVLYFRTAARRLPARPGSGGPDDSGPNAAGPRQRLRTLRRLFLGGAVFWLCFAQTGSVLSLYTRDDVDRRLGGLTVPASWFQSVSPLFILAAAPLFARLWLRLGARFAVAHKYALGLALMGASYLVLAVTGTGSHPVPVAWLLAALALQAFGEVALAPVGLAANADAGPPGATGTLMGLFFVSAALGAGLGAQLARAWAVVPHPGYFAGLATLALVTAALLARSGDRLIPTAAPTATVAAAAGAVGLRRV